MQLLKDSLTYMNTLKARDRKSISSDCEYKVEKDSSNVFVRAKDVDQFVYRHVGGTVPEEEQKIFIKEHKELLIAEWSSNPKPVQAP
jgi:hypothetical protein